MGVNATQKTDVSITGANKVDVISSSNSTTGNNTTQGTATDSKTTAKKTADSATVTKNLDASVKAYVASQPVQHSGLFGSNNNSGDIKARTDAAQSQANEVATLIKDNKLSTADALKVEKQFDSDLKAAAGQPLSTGQMLDLQIMIDNAATSSGTSTPVDSTTKSNNVAASPTDANSIVVKINNNPSSGVCIDVSSCNATVVDSTNDKKNYDTANSAADKKDTNKSAVVIQLGSGSNSVSKSA